MKSVKYYLFLSLTITYVGCEKFLDEKTDKRLVVPSSIRDLQSLLDNYSNLNIADPGEGEVSSDDYYLMDNTWAAINSEEDRRAYTWEPDYSTTQQRWFTAYRNVYWANIVLEGLEKVARSAHNQQEWDNVKGQALFLRAKSFLHVAAIWALAYDESTASADMGIPLRTNSDFNVPSHRANLQQTYTHIIADLKSAIDLLPNRPEVLLRPSRPAAMALLARTYLFMRDYEHCLKYAAACLQINGVLVDYNDLDPSLTFPLPLPLPLFENNREVLYFSHMSFRPHLSINNARVDTSLFHSYDENDLRKAVFFRINTDGTASFKGSYANSEALFSGISTNEVYLMRAECLARRGDVESAMTDLNHLLIHRYRNDLHYTPLVANAPEEALQYILSERRKELIFRGIRFPDVKRLNKEGANIGFKRILNGVEYTLPPNDLRFALPIPEEVLERAPEIIQNPR